MKTYILVFLLLFSNQVIVQDVASNEKIIQGDFLELNSRRLTDLIPFCKNGKWGYVDKKSKKIVISARYSHLNLFNQNILSGTINNETAFYVDSSGKVIIGRQEPDRDEYGYKSEIHDEKQFVSSKDGFKGFSLNSYGEVVTVSDIYDKCCFFELVRIQGKTYLILAKNKYFGIIDSLGNPLNGFNFIHNNICINNYSHDNKHVWFFVKKGGPNWSLQNEKGEVRFENEIPSSSKNFPYTKENFGIAVMSNNSNNQFRSGLFDCYELKWIIQPQSKFNIIDLNYSSTETLDPRNPLNRSKATIYFCIKEGKQDYYYSDLKQAIYYPSK